jgi:IS5 family transposase
LIKHEDGQLDFHDELLESLVSKNHPYRKIKKLVNFEKLCKPLSEQYSKTGTPSEPIERGFKCLLIQYWENFSDRQLERYLNENLPSKWFCGYGLTEKTPDHSYFGKLRKRIGLEKLSELFNATVKGLEKGGYAGNVFHFVDASSLLSKVNLWEARDKAIKDKENEEKNDKGDNKMNNQNVSKYSSDPDAKFGCKGGKNFWFGYKRHVRVDMRHGVITKVSVTSAEVTDGNAFIDEDLCPESGMVFMDKGYDSNKVIEVINKKGCANAVIQKINRKTKNRDLDRWRSGVRMPFENVFRNQPKYTRYRQKLKVQFQVIFETIAYNLKILTRLEGQLMPIV